MASSLESKTSRVQGLNEQISVLDVELLSLQTDEVERVIDANLKDKNQEIEAAKAKASEVS